MAPRYPYKGHGVLFKWAATWSGNDFSETMRLAVCSRVGALQTREKATNVLNAARDGDKGLFRLSRSSRSFG
jgi:hypothetical protein